MTQLRLLEDPRLRRLPLPTESPISEVRAEEGSLHTLYVGLAQPVVDRTSFTLSFLLTDTSAIGNLRLPVLEALGVRAAEAKLLCRSSPRWSSIPTGQVPGNETPSAVRIRRHSSCRNGEPRKTNRSLLSSFARLRKLEFADSSARPHIESHEQTVFVVGHGKVRATGSPTLMCRTVRCFNSKYRRRRIGPSSRRRFCRKARPINRCAGRRSQAAD